MSVAKKSGKGKKSAESSVGAEDNDDVVAIDQDEGPDEDDESPFRDPPDGCVRLRPSQFNGIPATVFVEYPPELGIQRHDISVIEPLGARKLGYKSYWERICIKNAHRRAGFVKSEKYWTSLWAKHQNAEQMKELNCLQKINHFPASWCIGRKDRLARTLNTMKRVHGANGSVFDFHPETFILPGERDSLHRLVTNETSRAASQHSSGRVVKTFNSSSASMSLAGGMWIVKPCASSCGQGIKVMTGQQALALPKKKKAIVQRYLARPYLIDGRKFDLRIYVLVSGVDPLRVYIHDEGLTRISTAKYTVKNLANSFAHLTNYSINKNAPNFKAAEFSTTDNRGNGEDEDGEVGEGEGEAAAGTNKEPGEGMQDPEMEGFKWSLAAFRRWLAKKEGRVVMEQTFDRIFDLCLKTMIAAESEITPHLHSAAQYRSNCFELFGCDVILDADLRPHLLEVNVSPSLMGSSPLDKKIKGMVIADILHIVGMYPHDPALLKKYGGAGSATQKTTSFRGQGGAADPPANPFAFSTLSKLMAAQDRYRRDPCPESIDISALGDTEASWLLLLTAENELQRARSSKFHCVHPTAANAAYYSGLYRSGRFSDHLLAHWVMHGGSAGRYGGLIPSKYRPLYLATDSVGPSVSPQKPVPASIATSLPSPTGGDGSRPRAKSAGRSSAARASTYIPAAMLVAAAADRMKLFEAAPAPSLRSVSVSPRPLPRPTDQASLTEGGQRRSRADREALEGDTSRHRGHSEPRHLQQAGRPAALSSPNAYAAPPLATPTSAVRARLALGISQAAEYYGDNPSGPSTPSPPRRACNRRQRGHNTDSEEEGAGLESVDVTTPQRTAGSLLPASAASPYSTPSFAQYVAAATATRASAGSDCGSGGASGEDMLPSAELTRRMLERIVRSQVTQQGDPRSKPSGKPSGSAHASGLQSTATSVTDSSAASRDPHPTASVPYIMPAVAPDYFALSGSTGRPPSAGRPLTAGASGRKPLAVENGLAITGAGDSKLLLKTDSASPREHGRLSLSPIRRVSSVESSLSTQTATSGSDSPVPSVPSPQKQYPRMSIQELSPAFHSSSSSGNNSPNAKYAPAAASPLKQRRVSSSGATYG